MLRQLGKQAHTGFRRLISKSEDFRFAFNLRRRAQVIASQTWGPPEKVVSSEKKKGGRNNSGIWFHSTLMGNTFVEKASEIKREINVAKALQAFQAHNDADPGRITASFHEVAPKILGVQMEGNTGHIFAERLAPPPVG